MRLAAEEDLAMVLPVPVPPSSPEDAVRFVDMSRCPTFFDQVDALFPAELSRGFVCVPAPAFAPQAVRLVVHDVGAFEASFVPRRADFDRLDPRFRLPSAVWDALPAYADWGFCVFKLKGATPAAQPSLLGRVARTFGVGAPAPPARDYHPMALEFPRRDPSSLFFPTVHVHDGSIHPTAQFDHALYCQGQVDPASSTSDVEWETSSAPAGAIAGGAREWLDLEAPVLRRRLSGELPNQDVYIAELKRTASG
jgi:hypothetical protein